MFLHSLFFYVSVFFTRIQRFFARILFEYERRNFVRIQRLIDLSEKVSIVPAEFGGGELMMDNLGKFFIVHRSQNLFNLKMERLNHEQAIDFAWVSCFYHIDWDNHQDEQEALRIEVARRIFSSFFGDCQFRQMKSKCTGA